MPGEQAIDFSQYADKPTAGAIDFSGYEDKPDTYKPGAGSAIWSDVKNVASSLPSLFPPVQFMNAVQKGVDQYKSLRDTGQTQEQLQSAQQKQAGYSVPYRLATPAAQAVGVDVSGMENSAAHGDPAGVLGHAAVPTAMAVAPLAGELIGKGLNRIIPSTTRAGTGLNMLEKRYGSAPIDPAGAASTINRFSDELAATPSVKLHPLLEDLRQRVITNDVASTHPEVAQQLAEQGLPTQNPLTFKEARSILKRLNEAKVGAKGVEYNSLAATADALSKDIQQGAEQAGFGKDYRSQVNEYRSGSKVIRAADAAGPAIGAVAGGYLGRNIPSALGMAEGAGMGAAAGKYALKPALGAAARAVIERDGGAPRLSAPPAVPTAASEPTLERSPATGRPRSDRMTPEEFTRMLLQAKEGDINPTEADRMTAKFTRKLARPQGPPAR